MYDNINIFNVIPCHLRPMIASERLIDACKIWYPSKTFLLLHTGNCIVRLNNSGRISTILSSTEDSLTMTQ